MSKFIKNKRRLREWNIKPQSRRYFQYIYLTKKHIQIFKRIPTLKEKQHTQYFLE